jgi:RNA polymerase sigma-70 factor (ECF subfamily)
MVLDGNDRDIIDGCRHGDYDSFRALFEAHKDRVYSIALRYSGDRAAAMDIAQDTFLKLLGSIRDYQGKSTFEAWLYRVVVNACLDHRRRGRRVAPFFDDLLDRLRAPAEGVLQRLVRCEVSEDVQRTVRRLSPEQRIVVVLRYTEDMSYEEIAEALGCSRGTVASRLNRAHKILERRLSHLKA